MGHLYRRGQTFWVKYYLNGRPVRESTGTTKEQEAKRFLKGREGRVAAGMPVMPRADRVRYDEAAKDLRIYYEASGSATSRRRKHASRAPGPFLRWTAPGKHRPPEATAYVVERQAKEASNGTINRELAVLNRMLRLAYENGKLLRLPVIRKLKEAAPREGFFEREQFEAVRRRLVKRPDLQTAISIAFTYGWRMQSEVLTLERRQLDLEAGTLRLNAGATKNDDGRVVYLTPELKAALAAQLERVKALERESERIIPVLFPRFRGGRRGEPIRDFRKAWTTACKGAGVPGMLRHDFRRTAVRNMVNAGVPERVAMKVTGHKTRAVFDRYHIVSPGDLRDVASRLAAASHS